MKYILSGYAEHDLSDIYDYSWFNFGIDGANDYFENLISCIERISEYPEIGVKRSELTEGTRSLICASHIIFYKADGNRILIIRVLHHSRDYVSDHHGRS